MKPIILTMGLNHTTAPIHVREEIASARCLQEQALDQLQVELNSEVISESLILSTCNRTEVYVVTADRAITASRLREHFSTNATFGSAANYLYSFADREAVAHLFSVASGLDSMVLGEFEILGQVRAAYQNAADQHTLGPVLHRLFKDAIHTGKRAHSDTNIGAGAASVAYAAVALARDQLGPLAGCRALVIGTGEMGRRVAEDLVQDTGCTLTLLSRTFEHAQELAYRTGGRAIRYDELGRALVEADLVISATGAPHVLLTAATVEATMRSRAGRPLCMIDIALPRDIDPDASAVPNVRLFNLDDLQHQVDENRALRQQAVADVQKIIAEQVQDFWDWYEERRAVPTIASLHEQAEQIRAAELDKALRRLSHLHLSDRDRNVIAALSAGIVGKLLAAPTVHLKERMQTGDGQVYLDTMNELFELHADEQDISPTL